VASQKQSNNYAMRHILFLTDVPSTDE